MEMNQSPEPMLSVLTPAVPSRMANLAALCCELQKQIGDGPVEHLVLLDNRKRTVGEKRDALLRAARGRYIAFSDDDDWIAPDYIESLLGAMSTNPDVITFRQHSTIDGEESETIFRLGSPNEPFKPGGTHLRNAWHVCAWRRSLAILSSFPPVDFGEDWAFCRLLCGLAGLREVHLDKVLHYYKHDSTKSEAPPPVDTAA